MTNVRTLGNLTVYMLSEENGVVDTFYLGHGPTFRTFATITQDGDGWFRVHPSKGLDGVYQTYRDAFAYLMSLGESHQL